MSSCEDDVVKNHATVQSKPLRDAHDTLGSECALSVDVHSFGFSTSSVAGKLGS